METPNDLLAKKFNNWYSEQISQQLESGKSLEEVDVKLRLSTLKTPTHWMDY